MTSIPPPTCELISTGSELLSGRSVNRHAQTLGEALRTIGLALRSDTTVPDDADLIREALERALGRSRFVLLSGGLGPTGDDLTRDVVAGVLGRSVVMDDTALGWVRARYTERGRPVTPAGDRHALCVEGATPLANRAGVAPGERIDLDGQTVFLLPGPPSEFRAVLEDHVLPYLAAQCPDATLRPEKIFMTAGIGESDLLEQFALHAFPPTGVDVAYCAGPGQVEVRISAAIGGEGLVEEAADKVRAWIKPHIVAERRCTMAEAVVDLLKAEDATLATAESCTGGLLGDRVTTVSGCSQVYLGGIIAYSNMAKINLLSVNEEDLEVHGAVSAQVARGMAHGVRVRFGADYGIGVTGIAGPSGSTEKKPVGLVYIAVSDPQGDEVIELRMPGERQWVKERSVNRALDLLRKRIAGKHPA